MNIYKSNEIKPENFCTKKDDIIIGISSIIHVSNHPMLGYGYRSIFSAKERFDQTIIQLKSIKEKIPNAITILLEESEKISYEEVIELSKLCSYVILFGEDKEAYHYCHETYMNKGLGEMYVTSFLGNLLRNKEFNIFCKFNGRSILSPNFDINTYKRDYPVVATVLGGGRLKILAYSNFYSIPKKFMNAYTEHILCWLDKTTTEPIEHILTMFVESIKHVYIIGKLNIEGKSGVTGELIKL
jgi:hypothetical protein